MQHVSNKSFPVTRSQLTNNVHLIIKDSKKQNSLQITIQEETGFSQNNLLDVVNNSTNLFNVDKTAVSSPKSQRDLVS